MPVETRKYVRKPLIVNGVQVTVENFAEIAEWCNGTIKWSHDGSDLFKNGTVTGTIDPASGEDPVDPEKQYIQVDVINPRSLRQSRAYVDDWVLGTETGYKIYTARAFENSFDEYDYKKMSNPDQLPMAEECKED